jgi:molybdopterin-guanine dinucleotide biosynthesis protein A
MTNDIKNLSHQQSTNNQQPTTTLAILAGGKATRLGGVNKALIEVEGETIISRIHRALSPICNEVLIISNQTQADYGIPAKTYPDIIENCGPLGGIHSALQHSTNEMVLVVSCDMPFISSNIANRLIDTYIKNQHKVDVVIPTLNGLNEPLLAVYSKNLSSQISEILSDHKGHRITDLLDICNTIKVEIEANPENIRSFTNINTFDDYNAFKNSI